MGLLRGLEGQDLWLPPRKHSETLGIGKPASLEAKSRGNLACAFDSRRLRQIYFKIAKASAPSATAPRPEGGIDSRVDFFTAAVVVPSSTTNVVGPGGYWGYVG